MKYRIDFFALEILSGFETLERYVALMEDQLPKAKDEDQKRINEAHLEEDEWQLEMQLHGMHFVRDFPRYLRYSFVAFVFSVFDSRLSASCDVITKKAGLPLRSKDLRSASSVGQARIFLERVASVKGNFPWESVTAFNHIRDCIVHANGQVSKSNVSGELKRLNGKIPGYSFHDDLLWLEKEFCHWAVGECHKFFEELLKPPLFGPLKTEIVKDTGDLKAEI